MSKLEAIIKQYRQAIKRFEEVLEHEKSDIVRDAAIQRFEFSFDLAWKSEKNTTAASFGDLNGNYLHLTNVYPALRSLGELKSVIQSEDRLFGVAIDAPLIINNISGQRKCEKLLSMAYGRRGVSCHSSNLDLYPNPAGVKVIVKKILPLLASELEQLNHEN